MCPRLNYFSGFIIAGLLLLLSAVCVQADSISAPAHVQRPDSVKPKLVLKQPRGYTTLDTLLTDSLVKGYFYSYYHYDTVIVPDSSFLFRPRLADIKPRVVQQNPMFFVMFCGLLFLVALFRMFNFRNQSVYIGKLMSFNTDGSFEELGVFNLTLLQFFFIHVVVVAFGIYQWLSYKHYPGIEGIHFGFYLKVAGVTALVYIVKYLVYWISGIALNLRQMSLSVISSSATVNYLFALLLLPLLIVIYYTPDKTLITALYLFIAILSVVYLTIRIFKGIVTHSSLFPYSIFHLFLYLCTFEIIPLLLVIKVVINNID